MAWIVIVPRWALRRLMGKLTPQAEPLLVWSWKRAFDGLTSPSAPPDLQLCKTPLPILLAWRLPAGKPTLLVSSGWLLSLGEDAFRAACRQAASRFCEPSLGLESSAAFVLSFMTPWVTPGFWSFAFLPRSDLSRPMGLTPLGFAAALPVWIWMRWIAWVGLKDGRSALSSGAGSLLVDWAGPTETWLGPVFHYLALPITSEAEVPLSSAAEKSILSWIPARG
jgi:hypothetical protein